MDLTVSAAIRGFYTQARKPFAVTAVSINGVVRPDDTVTNVMTTVMADACGFHVR